MLIGETEGDRRKRKEGAKQATSAPHQATTAQQCNSGACSRETAVGGRPARAPPEPPA